MSKVELCRPHLDPIWQDVGTKVTGLDHWDTWWGNVRPKGIKRIRMKCPKCGRRVWSSVRVCHDGCCIIHTIPAHKPKHWWKRKKK